ncbi:MAG: hypothetical protein JRJ66_00120 [Deltaproteobacteria bacterium]|nr:hypothetical protein [Deltaproteobacteria bacterium]
MKPLLTAFLTLLIILKFMAGSTFLYLAEDNPSFLEENAIASEPHKGPTSPAKEKGPNSKQEKIDLSLLLQKKAQLEEEEKRIARQKAELLALQKELDRKIETLTQLRNEIRMEIVKKQSLEDQKLKHLIKAYSTMKPQKAAALVEKLDMGFAIELLSRMRGDAVGKILSFVDLEKAAKISEGLAKEKRN